MSKKTSTTLTPLELEFVLAFDGNIRGTARRLGIDRSNAQAMMNRPCVRKAVDKKIEEALKHSGKKLAKLLCLSAEEVNHGIAQLATYDLRKCVTENNSPIPIKQWDDAEGMALCSFKIADIFEGTGEARQKTGELKEFKMADRGQNLERAARILGMVIERHMSGLPLDWDSHTIEEKRFYVKEGYWPDSNKE